MAPHRPARPGPSRPAPSDSKEEPVPATVYVRFDVDAPVSAAVTRTVC